MSAGGVIRPARRPRGWIAPGPRPPGALGRPELEPRDGEDLCYLCGEWRLFQHVDGHRWSLDDLVTAWLAARVALELDARRAVDLGCGLGSVLLMVAWRAPALDVTGVEAQPSRAALARRSIAWNGVEARCRVVDGDLRDVRLEGPVDLVTCTPPYFPPGTGTEPTDARAAPSRFEHRGGVEDYLAAAARLVEGHPRGRVVLCASFLELARVSAATAAAGLAPAERWTLVPRTGKPPLLTFQVLGTPAAVPGSPAERTLTVRDARGQWTPELREIRAAMGMPPTPP